MDLIFSCSPSPRLLSAWRPRVLSKQLGSLQLLPSARRNLRRCFPYFSSFALGLSLLSWGPRVLSKHLGTLYKCFPGLLRSSLLVFLQLASSLAVSPGSAGVPWVLSQRLGTRYNCSPGLAAIFATGFLMTRFLARALLASLGSLGCFFSTWGLSTITP